MASAGAAEGGSCHPPSLRLLFVSDLWPPHVIGGYELGARDIAEGMKARGHAVEILTSTFGVGSASVEGPVHRLLYEDVRGHPLRQRQLAAETWKSYRMLSVARRFLAGRRPDLIYLFNPLGLTAALMEELGRFGPPVVAYISDDWPMRWPATDPLLARWFPNERLPTA